MELFSLLTTALLLSSWKISILVCSCATLQPYRIHFFKPCVMLRLWIFPRVPRHALESSVVGHAFTSTFGVRLLFAALPCPVVLCVPAVYCRKWNLLDCSLWRTSQAFYHCYGASFMFQGVLFLGLRGFPFSLRLFHKHILSTCTPTSLPLLCATPFPHKTQKPHPYLTFPTSSLHLWRWFYSFIPLALSWSHPTDSFSYEESKLYSWGDVYLFILFHLLKIFVHIHMVCYFPVLSFEIVLFYGVINEIFIDCIFWLFIFCTKVQFVSLYWSSTLQLSELAHGSPRAFFVVSVWEITPCADVHVSICSCVFWVAHVCRLI